MGIRGLTSVLEKMNQMWHTMVFPEVSEDDTETEWTHAIVDGPAMAHYLYHKPSINVANPDKPFEVNPPNWIKGGQYEEYAMGVRYFFEKLNRCRIAPVVIMDGVIDEAKRDTSFSRVAQSIRRVRAGLYPSTSNNASNSPVLPIFADHVFMQVVREQGVPMLRADFEADEVVAWVAGAHKCLALSQDSDFFVYNRGFKYVPFNAVTLTPESISVQWFDTQEFIKSAGIKHGHIGLLATLMGNDTLPVEWLHVFHNYVMNMFGGASRSQQKSIDQRWKLIQSIGQFLAQYPETSAAVDAVLSVVFPGTGLGSENAGESADLGPDAEVDPEAVELQRVRTEFRRRLELSITTYNLTRIGDGNTLEKLQDMEEEKHKKESEKITNSPPTLDLVNIAPCLADDTTLIKCKFAHVFPDEKDGSMPSWIIKRYRKCEFHNSLAQLLRDAWFACWTVVEDVTGTNKSVWVSSRELRRIIYSIILGGGEGEGEEESVQEYLRKNLAYGVQKIKLSTNKDLPVFKQISNMSLEDRVKGLMNAFGTAVEATKGTEEKKDEQFSLLDVDALLKDVKGDYKLAILALRYWIATSEEPVLFWEIAMVIGCMCRARGVALKGGNDEKASETRPKIIHRISQWHSVLYDSILLNEAFNSPFPSSRPDVVCDGATLHSLLEQAKDWHLHESDINGVGHDDDEDEEDDWADENPAEDLLTPHGVNFGEFAALYAAATEGLKQYIGGRNEEEAAGVGAGEAQHQQPQATQATDGEDWVAFVSSSQLPAHPSMPHSDMDRDRDRHQYHDGHGKGNRQHNRKRGHRQKPKSNKVGEWGAVYRGAKQQPVVQADTQTGIQSFVSENLYSAALLEDDVDYVEPVEEEDVEQESENENEEKEKEEDEEEKNEEEEGVVDDEPLVAPVKETKKDKKGKGKGKKKGKKSEEEEEDFDSMLAEFKAIDQKEGRVATAGEGEDGGKQGSGGSAKKKGKGGKSASDAAVREAGLRKKNKKKGKK